MAIRLCLCLIFTTLKGGRGLWSHATHEHPCCEGNAAESALSPADCGNDGTEAGCAYGATLRREAPTTAFFRTRLPRARTPQRAVSRAWRRPTRVEDRSACVRDFMHQISPLLCSCGAMSCHVLQAFPLQYGIHNSIGPACTMMQRCGVRGLILPSTPQSCPGDNLCGKARV